MSQGSYAAECANSKPTHITPVSYSKGVHVSNVFMLSHLFFIVVLSVVMLNVVMLGVVAQ